MKGYPLLASTIAIFLLSFLITIYCYANNSVILQKLDNSTLWLEIVVNGKPSGKVVPVEYHDHSFWLTQNDLKKVGLSMLTKDNHTLIAINKINGIEVTYSSELQQLLVDIPNSWLPLQRIVVNKTNYQYSLAKSSFGALINYDLYITSPEQSNAANTATLWTEQRFFGNHGIIYNTGIYRQSFNGSTTSNQNNRYLRYETQGKYSNKETMTSYVLGDYITNVLSGSNAVRLGGFQINRNFATRPDLITYPLPDFTGSAAIPSTVDLYINNYYNSSTGLFEYQTNAYRDSPKKNTGHQAVLGYTYTNQIFSVNAQRIIRAKDYADLSSYRSGYRPNRRQDQLTVSLGMNKLGTLGIGYFALKNTKVKSTKLINASWSTNIWHNINIYTSLNKEIGRQGVSAQLLFTIPFYTLGMVSINSSRDNNNH